MNNHEQAGADNTAPEVLRPCPVPWCGETEQISFIVSHWTGKACVECLSCKARGPFCTNKAEAIAAWNTRTPEAGDTRRGDGGLLQQWLDWHDRAAADDDDCEYLNDHGWDDVAALAEQTRAALTAKPVDGYKEAFYQLSDLMGIPAQTRSPREVWEAEMLPKLRDALTKPVDAPADVVEMVERLETGLEAIQWGDRPLPWVVHTGCSYRRIASEPTAEGEFRSFPDGNVLHAYKQSDGHPDLSMGERELEALVSLVNALPNVAAMLTALAGQKAPGDQA